MHRGRVRRTVDVKRGTIFSKFSKEISVAARLGGGGERFGRRVRERPRRRHHHRPDHLRVSPDDQPDQGPVPPLTGRVVDDVPEVPDADLPRYTVLVPAFGDRKSVV